jgi:hypothetical protein
MLAASGGAWNDLSELSISLRDSWNHSMFYAPLKSMITIEVRYAEKKT